MGYTYTPAYYSSFQDSITSICKSILPFSFKKRGLPAAERKLSKQQTDNLKWQQDSFHQILNLMGLHKEGILPETEVSAFKSKLLETLIASKGTQHEHPVILRDKLLFLQELLYAKCISDEDYHASKRPLLQRLAVQGAEIDSKDVIVGGTQRESSDEEWSVIDLRDEQCLINKDSSAQSKSKSKLGSSAIKHIKEAASVLRLGGSSQKQGKNKSEKSIFYHLGSSGIPNPHPTKQNTSKVDQNDQLGENPFWCTDLKEGRDCETRSILMHESSALESDKLSNKNEVKKKDFLGLFNKEEGDGNGGDECNKMEEGGRKPGKKQWGFNGFKKWNRGNSEDETAPLPLNERSDYDQSSMNASNLVAIPIGEGLDTQQIKRKLHSEGSTSDLFIDKVNRKQTELSSIHSTLQFSNDEIEIISTKLPVHKADQKKFSPKSFCDQHGEVMLDAVKKEFKDHVSESAQEKKNTNPRRWATFDDDENCHPNLFSPQQHRSTKLTTNFPSNPFLQEDENIIGEHKLISQSFSNPFWNQSLGPSKMY